MGGVLDILWRKLPHQPPGPFYNLRDLQKTKANQHLETKMSNPPPENLHDYSNSSVFVYAHIEVVVTFLVVIFFAFLVIAPYPTIRF